MLLLLLLFVLSNSIAKPKLALFVVAPNVDNSVPSPRNGVVLTTRNLNNVITLVRIKLSDSLRVLLIDEVSSAELSPVVETPSKHMTLLVDVEGVMVAAEDVDCASLHNLSHVESVVLRFFMASSNLAKLERVRITPAQKLTFRCESERVVGATDNLFYFCLVFEYVCKNLDWLQ